MSVSIIIRHDPEGINKRELISLDPGTRLLDFLIKEYGSDGFDVPTAIFHGDAIKKNEIDQDCFDLVNKILNDNDIVNIIHRPQGTTEIVIALIAIFAGIILAPDALAPPPQVENPNFPKTNESPNNRLVGQSNVARPLARIPDIYGRMRVYPDLGSKTVTEFIQHIKFVTEYLIIGRGEYVLNEIKSGETLIDNIPSASFTIFEPGDIIPELIDINDSNEVNGQEVKAPNDPTNFVTQAANVTFGTSGFSGQDPGLAAFEGLEIGATFDISGTPSNNGTFTMAGFTKTSIPAEPPDFDAFTSYSISVEETTTAETVASSVGFESSDSTSEIGPFTVPGETEEVWIDIIAPRGLANRISGTTETVTISFDIILDEIDSFGAIINTETTQISISDNTLDARFYTFKITPANPGNQYQATLKRISSTIEDAAYYDVTNWSRLAGVGKIIDFDQGNVTSIVLTTQATEQATKAQERKFNAIAIRKLRTYTVAGGVIIPALTATTRFADAMLEHLTNSFIGNKATSDIDLDQLYTIQEDLDADPIYGSVLGRFSYSFSSDKASVKDELLIIANAVRVFIRKIGNNIEFGRDEIQATRTTLFNTRTKKPKSEKKTRRLQKPTGFDGIELQWVWEDTGEPFTVIFPESPAPAPINPKRIEAAGIRNFKQAWNRAKIEFLKLKLQRETVKFQSTKEGLLSLIGDRVANADGTDIKAQSGEIKSLSGFDVEVFTPIDFNGNPTATVILRSESGVADPEITVTPRLDGVDGFILDNLPSFSIRVRGDLDYQVGTLYTFALTGEQKIKDYLIQKISPKTNGYVSLELLNYDAAIYDPDTETPPAHETTLTKIKVDAVASAQEIPDHSIANEAAAVETLAWVAEPTGTFEADSATFLARQIFTVDDLGNWDITGSGDTFDTGSGDYRPQVEGQDDDNYEIKITESTSGTGVVNPLGGVIFGSFVPLTGGQGISITDATASTTVSNITVEIREIATPANTTGVASFTFDCDGSIPI